VIVILDATVPLNFARVDRLDLLGRVPASLHVGRIVAADELRHWPTASARASTPFDILTDLGTDITLAQMQDDNELALYARCRDELGRGESECVAIASRRSWTVATDDGHARRILERHAIGVKLTGTIGLLRMLEKVGVLASTESEALVQSMKAGGGRLP
jgi:predicted nucleic acid-binding protein